MSYDEGSLEVVVGKLREMDERELRGPKNGGGVAKIPIRVLKESAQQFLRNIEEIFWTLEGAEGAAVELAEVEVSASVTSSGSFRLFGIGADTAAEGGIKFVFKRRSTSVPSKAR